MIRGTTPTFRLTVKGIENFSGADHIYVTIEQGPVSIDLADGDVSVEDNVVICRLTQEQSFKLVERQKAKIQVNWTYPPDETGFVARPATVSKEITIGEQLLKKVLP